MSSPRSSFRRSRRAAAFAVSCALSMVVVGAPGVGSADEIRDGQWWFDELGVAEAHEITRGHGVTIGVLDSGVDAAHPDLEGSVDAGWSPWAGGEDGLNDTIGHGTAMAALLVGHGHGPGNADGILGVAPEARVISAGIAPNGLVADPMKPWESTYSDEDVREGITFLADAGADVILTALAGSFTNQTQAVFEEIALDRNIPIIAGVGNKANGDEFVREPAIWPFMISVAGTAPGGEAWDGSVSGFGVSMAAPAAEMDAARPGGGYEYGEGGTSAASAITAGVVALMKAQWPDMGTLEIGWRLMETAIPPDGDDPDNKFGAGIVDPVAALTAEVDQNPRYPELDMNPEPNPIRPTGDESGVPDGDPVADGGDDASGIPMWWIAAGAGVLVVAAVSVVILSRRRRTSTIGAPVPPPSPQVPGPTPPGDVDPRRPDMWAPPPAPGSPAPHSFPQTGHPNDPHPSDGAAPRPPSP